MSSQADSHEAEGKQAGISEEEQREIRAHIDQVAAENRIEVTPQLFRLQAKKSGAVVPVVVNILAAGVLGLGFLGFSTYFRAEEQAVMARAGQSSLVESRLIQELRRESRSQLVEMEREIEGVRAQLAAVERDRENLLVDIERRVSAREDEVRARLLEELAAERSRLDELGLAEADIEQRMIAFEAERTLHYERQLEEYRQRLELERVALELDLDRVRNEFSSRLNELGAERAQIAGEFQVREAQLRERLAARTAALEEERARAEAGIEDARRRIDEITRAREQVSLLRSQINGLYASIRNRYEAGEFSGAAQGIADLRSFLATDAVLSLQELAERREIDLFLLDTIERAVDRARSAQEEAGSRVLEGLTALEELRDELEAVQALLEENRSEQEAALSRAGLAVESARSAVAEQRYNDALASYREIFATLPLGESELTQELVSLLQQGGFGAQARAALAAPTAAPQTTVVQDEQELRRLESVIAEQLVVVNRYIAVQELYMEYARSEDAVLNASGEFGRLRTKAMLDEFLTDAAVRQLLPGLHERVRGYDIAFETAGREDALQDMIDIVASLAQVPSPERIAFLEAEIRAGDESSLLQDFLYELRDLVGS